MEILKLHMILLGCKPQDRNTEQHDIFFGIGNSLKDIIPDLVHFWKNAGLIHIDAWREVTMADGYKIKVLPKDHIRAEKHADNKLFFLNLGGYKKGEFEEYHYKMIVVAKKKADAIQQAKQTAFYRHTGFTGAVSHIDDKYGLDVDDIYEVKDILPVTYRDKYTLEIIPEDYCVEDKLHLGYTLLSKLIE